MALHHRAVDESVKFLRIQSPAFPGEIGDLMSIVRLPSESLPQIAPEASTSAASVHYRFATFL